MRAILDKLGVFSFEGARSHFFVADSPAQLQSAAPLFAILRERMARIDIAVAARKTTRGDLAALLSDCHEVPLPWSFGPIATRLLLRVNCKMLVFIAPPGPGDAALLRAAKKRMLPIVVLDPALFDAGGNNQEPSGYAAAWGDKSRPMAAVEQFYLASEALAPALARAGVSKDRITVMPQAASGDSGLNARLNALADALRQYLTRDFKLLRGEARPIRRSLEAALLWAMDRNWLRPLTGLRFRRVESLADLRSRLGNPKTLLCLGNGPSSEDPSLAEFGHDALFRVNHRWQERGFLAEPQVVFTGSRDSVSLLSDVIFGFLSIQSEGRMLYFWKFSARLRRLNYLTVERLDVFLRQGAWRQMRPTNGASMLATAVALQPARLVVSGFDLFSHPQGSYPGDTATPNAYSAGHDPDRELDALLHALSLYRGELTIVSAPLAEAWASYQAESSYQAARD